jgi:hypothetical protein
MHVRASKEIEQFADYADTMSKDLDQQKSSLEQSIKESEALTLQIEKAILETCKSDKSLSLNPDYFSAVHVQCLKAESSKMVLKVYALINEIILRQESLDNIKSETLSSIIVAVKEKRNSIGDLIAKK